MEMATVAPEYFQEHLSLVSHLRTLVNSAYDDLKRAFVEDKSMQFFADYVFAENRFDRLSIQNDLYLANLHDALTPGSYSFLIMADTHAWMKVDPLINRFLGYSSDELELNWYKAVHPDYLEATDVFLTGDLQCKHAGVNPSYEARVCYRHKAGFKVWGQVNFLMERGPDGLPLFYRARVTDVSPSVWADIFLKELSAVNKLLKRCAVKGKHALEADLLQQREARFFTEAPFRLGQAPVVNC